MAVDEKSQNTIDRCGYRDPQRPGLAQPPIPVPMYRGEFTITLYETRTGRRIHRTTISGQDAECPSTLPAGVSSTDERGSPMRRCSRIPACRVRADVGTVRVGPDARGQGGALGVPQHVVKFLRAAGSSYRPVTGTAVFLVWWFVARIPGCRRRARPARNTTTR
ncbi:hypothetical protein GCM10009557_63650 [Virgisporangium ochraceum]|uniref:Uncharacterized protein n=1 Tax=Virgisporangium ochraceum TaxID=65505 RepID=A0A8J4EI59_9ACTN|nr:hypothetical protein Voc01_078290 [Virgisporangium ochraceum]